jgi:hypothetical protein
MPASWLIWTALLAGDLHADDPAERREALAALVLRARALPAAEETRVRASLEGMLPRERDGEARALCIRALGLLGGEAALAPLLRAMATEEEPGPQAALVDAFGDLPAASAAVALSRVAFHSEDPREGALAAEALGRVAGDGSLRALLTLAEATRPWPVQAAVLRGLSLRGDPRAVEAAVRALRSPEVAVRAAAREAVEALLREDLGEDPAAWEKRWAEVKEGWKPRGGGAPSPDAETTTLPAPRPEARTTARFYDIPVAGSRVAFVMDCSQSMWGEKMESAREELLAAVKGLRSTQRFGVVLFNEKVWTWREVLVPATPAQKWAFARTLPDLPTKSYTNIHDSLERAFGWAGAGRRAVPDPPGLDDLFFLTDGEPNRGRTRDPGKIAGAVRDWNAAARVRVHTVALGDRPAGGLLERLAAENGGRFTRR